MTESAVVNASPLIFLSRADLVELLRLAAEIVVVPEPVAEEILQRGPSDSAARAIETRDWLRVVEAPGIPESVQGWNLGPGESSVLAWCQVNGAVDCIIDDLSARRCARVPRLPVRGTLGLVILGKKRGLFPAARPILEGMRNSGMYLSDRVLDRALATVGE